MTCVIGRWLTVASQLCPGNGSSRIVVNDLCTGNGSWLTVVNQLCAGNGSNWLTVVKDVCAGNGSWLTVVNQLCTGNGGSLTVVNQLCTGNGSELTVVNDLCAGNVSFSGWCPVAWDDLMCWDRAPPDTAILKPCPEYVPKFKTHGEYLADDLANRHTLHIHCTHTHLSLIHI